MRLPRGERSADAAEKPSRQVVEAVEKVRIAAFPGTITALLYVAEEKGFFERHDLKASLTVYDAGITSLEDLAAGKIDIATVMEFPFAIGRVKMDDLRIIGSVAASKNLELIMRRDRGISRPSDCRGRRIGVMQGTFGEFFLGVFLSFNGIGAAEIEKVDLRPSEMEEAIARGEVDGVIVWPPFVYQIKQKMGNQVVSWPAQGTQDSYALMVAKEAYTRSRPAVIERLLRALLDAQRLHGTTYGRRPEDRATSVRLRNLLPARHVVAKQAGGSTDAGPPDPYGRRGPVGHAAQSFPRA